ncbi:glycosyltransferase family 2 protein [Butyrivibrio sp. M55]|uniref:glycosyltransferase family 2 protein n=1 Tax=Butyrivibrio sp. M55 TaxID=1855323 RepID=UPI0008E6228F|nr:glycosyltransferase family 2 protein [Butyrivibrio sp. M55]SFU66041.1 Glycosyltransferase involved in cell wall bisynthesis [Butyrivibrio sp. M55]
MYSEHPMVSIIVPVYNLESYIEDCIKSVLAQSYKHFELIIIDDGSEDGTNEICRRYACVDNRITLITQRNLGVVLARRRGLSEATGKYVTFVDGDDWIENDMLQIMIDNATDSDMVCCGVSWEEKKASVIKKRDSFAPGIYENEQIDNIKCKMLYDMEHGASQLLTAWMWSKLYRLDKLKEAEAHVDAGVYFYEDALLVYRYAMGGRRIAFVDEYPYHYRYRSESASHRIDPCAIANINSVYLGLLDIANDYSNSYSFAKQAVSWFLEKSYFTLNERMGLRANGRIIRYLLDQSEIAGKSIVLYGAGRVGNDLYAQMKTIGTNVVLWVDKRAKELCDDRIASVDKIAGAEYDLLLIAVESSSVAEKIALDLIGRGVSTGKILKAKIHRLF